MTAEALFREGRRSADAGNYALACPRFEESNRLDPAPGTLLNLADCEEHVGHLAFAWEHFRRLAEELPEQDARRPIAEARARALESRIPKLRIALVGQVPATVVRDGAVLGPASLGVALPVDPGRHTVVVSSPGRLDRVYDVPVPEGQEVQLRVVPGQPGTAAEGGAGAASNTTPPAEGVDAEGPPSHASWRGTTQLVLGGVGAASLVTGAAFGVAALVQLSASNGSCNQGVCSNEDALSQYHSAQSFAHVSDVMLGVGVVCLGTAIVLAVTGHHGPPPDASGWSPATMRFQF